MLRQKLQYYGYLMWRANSLAKTLMLPKIGAEEGDDGRPDTWMASPTQWIWVWTSSGRWSRARRRDILQSMGLWRVGDDWVMEQQITASGNKYTECLWAWVVSGALEACHRSETQDSGKTLNVFDLELVKQPLICATTLTQWMSVSYMVYLLWRKWRTTWVGFMTETLYVHTSDGLCLILYIERSTRSVSQHWNWIMVNHCVWWAAVVEKSMKVCGSPESMDGDKLRVCSTLSGQRIFWSIYQN